MPKHIPTSPDNEPFSRHTRQNGYTCRYYNPYSPFQRLISKAMHTKGLSFRSLGQKLDVSPSSLWIWLHNENGFPGKRSFFPERHIPLLAKFLNLDQKQIQESLDLSRAFFAEKSMPSPIAITSAFDDLIEILENKPGRSINREWILNLARRLRAGAMSESVRDENNPIYNATPPEESDEESDEVPRPPKKSPPPDKKRRKNQ